MKAVVCTLISVMLMFNICFGETLSGNELFEVVKGYEYALESKKTLDSTIRARGTHANATPAEMKKGQQYVDTMESAKAVLKQVGIVFNIDGSINSDPWVTINPNGTYTISTPTDPTSAANLIPDTGGIAETYAKQTIRNESLDNTGGSNSSFNPFQPGSYRPSMSLPNGNNLLKGTDGKYIGEIDTYMSNPLNHILLVLLQIGWAIAVCISAVLGIKLLFATPQKKAEVKSALAPYLVGLLLLIAGIPIAIKVIETIYIKIF